MLLGYSTKEYGGHGPEVSMRLLSDQRRAYLSNTASQSLRLARGSRNEDCHCIPCCPLLTLLLATRPRESFSSSADSLSTSPSGVDLRLAATASAFFNK